MGRWWLCHPCRGWWPSPGFSRSCHDQKKALSRKVVSPFQESASNDCKVEVMKAWPPCLRARHLWRVSLAPGSLWDLLRPLLQLLWGSTSPSARFYFLHSPHSCWSQGHSPINFLQANLCLRLFLWIWDLAEHSTRVYIRDDNSRPRSSTRICLWTKVMMVNKLRKFFWWNINENNCLNIVNCFSLKSSYRLRPMTGGEIEWYHDIPRQYGTVSEWSSTTKLPALESWLLHLLALWLGRVTYFSAPHFLIGEMGIRTLGLLLGLNE